MKYEMKLSLESKICDCHDAYILVRVDIEMHE